jgi:hypothetical protein
VSGGTEAAEQAGELRLAPESIEALAVRLAEIVTGAAEPPRPAGRAELISAAEVSRWWSISRRWVYNHAEELGARRLGAGRRPRLRFDPEEVAERLGPRGGGVDVRRLPAMHVNRQSDSLSRRSRAMVAGQAKKRPGRRANAPRPGAELGGAVSEATRKESSDRCLLPDRLPGSGGRR